MPILLFTAAALLAVSGALKLRSTARIGLGPAPLALAEMAAALGLAFLALPNPFFGTAFARWSVPAAILLLVGSSIDHAVRLRELRRRRAESEERRLATFIEYGLRSGEERPEA